MLLDQQGNLHDIRELKLPDDSSTSSDSLLLEAFLAGFWARDGLR